jgi:hypothetical protein
LGRRLPDRHRDDCDAGHDPALAPRTRRAHVDVRRRTWPASRAAGPHPNTGHPDGHRESDLGLHENPRCLAESGQRVGRSTIARILQAAGIPPSRERPMTWRTFIRAHWPALLAANFFATEVWTHCGLLTYYTAFVIELHSRRSRDRLDTASRRRLCGASVPRTGRRMGYPSRRSIPHL